MSSSWKFQKAHHLASLRSRHLAVSTTSASQTSPTQTYVNDLVWIVNYPLWHVIEHDVRDASWRDMTWNDVARRDATTRIACKSPIKCASLLLTGRRPAEFKIYFFTTEWPVLNDNRTNRRFPSCLSSLFHSESFCEAFIRKLVLFTCKCWFIYMWIN